MRFISSMPWVRKNEIRLKGFISLEEIFLGKNKITDLICLINYDIFPPNMYYFTLRSDVIIMINYTFQGLNIFNDKPNELSHLKIVISIFCRILCVILDTIR